MQRVSVRYEGLVQGIGFRYTAVSLAQLRHVSGYVSNQNDGSVLLVAEGEENELQSFLNDIRASHLGRYIQREDTNWSAATGEMGGFRIAH